MHACNQLNLINLFALLEFEKFQAPKYKSQININGQNLKFKTDKVAERHRQKVSLCFGRWSLEFEDCDLGFKHPFSKI